MPLAGTADHTGRGRHHVPPGGRHRPPGGPHGHRCGREPSENLVAGPVTVGQLQEAEKGPTGQRPVQRSCPGPVAGHGRGGQVLAEDAGVGGTGGMEDRLVPQGDPGFGGGQDRPHGPARLLVGVGAGPELGEDAVVPGVGPEIDRAGPEQVQEVSLGGGHGPELPGDDRSEAPYRPGRGTGGGHLQRLGRHIAAVGQSAVVQGPAHGPEQTHEIAAPVAAPLDGPEGGRWATAQLDHGALELDQGRRVRRQGPEPVRRGGRLGPDDLEIDRRRGRPQSTGGEGRPPERRQQRGQRRTADVGPAPAAGHTRPGPEGAAEEDGRVPRRRHDRHRRQRVIPFGGR